MSESFGAQSSIASTNQAAPQAQSPAQNASSEKHRVKVEGQERELTLDELKRDYQLREASNKRFQEASQKEKRAQPIIDALEKKEFRKLLQHVPEAEFKAFMEDYLLEKYDYDALPEHEKRRIAAEERTAALEAEIERRDEDKNKAGYQRALADAATSIDVEIAEAIQKLGKKATPQLVGRMVDDMIAAYETSDGKVRLPAAKAAELAQKRLDRDVDAYLSEMAPDEIVSRLPPQMLDAIRKHFLGQVGMQPTRRMTGTPAQRSQTEERDRKPVSINAAFDQIEARLNPRRKAK